MITEKIKNYTLIVFILHNTNNKTNYNYNFYGIKIYASLKIRQNLFIITILYSFLKENKKSNNLDY